MEFVVIGRPAPQGSKRAVGPGRMIEMSKYVKPWRSAVVAAIRQQHTSSFPEWIKTVPLALSVVFTLTPPKRVLSLTVPSAHTVTPDLDKLVRSTMDGITESGLWLDDGQVTTIAAYKSYPTSVLGAHVNALDQPGARIMVWRAD